MKIVPAVMVSHESLTGLFSLPADVSGMSRWHSRLLGDLATRLADELKRHPGRGERGQRAALRGRIPRGPRSR